MKRLRFKKIIIQFYRDNTIHNASCHHYHCGMQSHYNKVIASSKSNETKWGKEICACVERRVAIYLFKESVLTQNNKKPFAGIVLHHPTTRLEVLKEQNVHKFHIF